MKQRRLGPCGHTDLLKTYPDQKLSEPSLHSTQNTVVEAGARLGPLLLLGPSEIAMHWSIHVSRPGATPHYYGLRGPIYPLSVASVTPKPCPELPFLLIWLII